MARMDREFFGVWVVLATSFVVGELGSFGSGVAVPSHNRRSSGVRIQSERGSALVLPLQGLTGKGASINRRLEYEARWEDARMTLHDDLLTKGCAFLNLAS